MNTAVNKMTVEIWSDVMCPFCYLGKRRFENAMAQFPDRDKIEVIWKSFLLNPGLKTDETISVFEYLSREKGLPIEQARQMNNQLAQAGMQEGLEYNFDKVVVANTLRAHNFLHFSKEQGRQGEVKERLLKAYFTEGKNVDDIKALIKIGEEFGFNVEALKYVLDNGSYDSEVQKDLYEAQQIGIRGVPFFVFNDKYAVSGAQDASIFLQVLKRSFAEWGK